MNRMTTIATALLAAAALGLTACADDEQEATAAGPVAITGAWARVTPPEAKTGAIYMKIASEDGDTLTGASVPPEVAGMTQIHETVVGEGHGEMKMQEVAQLDVPAGGSVELKPGGYHVMLMKLAEPIAAGDSVPVTLTFERAGKVKVDAVAREG
jgi:copper(I)-binding protein